MHAQGTNRGESEYGTTVPKQHHYQGSPLCGTSLRNIWHIDAHLAHRNTSGTSAHIWHIGAYIWHIWRIRGQDIGKLSLPMGSFIRIHQGHHRVRNQGECYSSLSADSVLTQPRLWDCSLFFSPVGWPRVPRSSIAAGACTPFPSFHLPHPAVSLGIPDTPSQDTSPQFPESSKS